MSISEMAGEGCFRHPKISIYIWICYVLLIFLHPCLGIDAHEQLADPSLEERARALSQQILCPTCQGQILDGSSVEAAVQLRSHIRLALNQGKSDQHILEALVARYGEHVITTPPAGWGVYVLWGGPWALFILVVGIFMAVKWREQRDKRV